VSGRELANNDENGTELCEAKERGSKRSEEGGQKERARRDRARGGNEGDGEDWWGQPALGGPEGAPERAGPQVRSGRSTTGQCCAVRRGWSLARLNSSAPLLVSRLASPFPVWFACIASRCHRKFRRAWIGHVERVCDSGASERFRACSRKPFVNERRVYTVLLAFSNGNYMVIR